MARKAQRAKEAEEAQEEMTPVEANGSLPIFDLHAVSAISAAAPGLLARRKHGGMLTFVSVAWSDFTASEKT